MSDSFLDHLPSQEREKIRKRMRSPEAYERLREKVKGPEDLERAMDRSEKMAELHFALESDPRLRESLKNAIAEDVAEGNSEKMFDGEISTDAQQALEKGNFSVAVESHPETHDDVLAVVAEGTVQEKIPLKQSFAEKYTGNKSNQ